MDKADKPDKPKILVVDDEVDNLDLVARILRRRYEVVTASSGPEALALLRKHRFAAILSDQRMPEMTGTQFLTEASRLVPETVRMILTGFSGEQDSMDAINLAHVSSFLTKPAKPEAIERAVADAVSVFDLHMRNQELIRELASKNSELTEAKHLVELSLDERTKELLQANERLQSLALRDSLTGLYNHRFLQERLGEEIDRMRRYGTPVSLVLADLDFFRIYNAANGHPAGDAVLVQLASVLMGGSRASDIVARLRPTDMVARYGGEEFAITVPATGKVGAAAMCERIRASIAAIEAPGTRVLPTGKITVSFGIAECPTDGETKEELIAAANTALVRAKQNGRDRIEIY